jgi:hypothetical protein
LALAEQLDLLVDLVLRVLLVFWELTEQLAQLAHLAQHLQQEAIMLQVQLHIFILGVRQLELQNQQRHGQLNEAKQIMLD